MSVGRYATYAAYRAAFLTNRARARARSVPRYAGADRGIRWWVNLLHWIDEADLIAPDPDTADWIQDMLVDRPTEYAALFGLFMRAYAVWTHKETLTPRQQQALHLAREAVAIGADAAQYVAARMNITPRAVYYLFERSEKHIETFNLGGKVPNRNGTHVLKFPAKETIQKRKAAVRYRCPGHGANEECAGWTDGYHGVCWSCAKKYGLAGERPEWLDYLILQGQKEAREQALDELLLTGYDYDDAADDHWFMDAA